MSEPFLGEIRLFAFQAVPPGWARCDGQLLQIVRNQSLYSILGTTYGGDGRRTFGLPDLRGRTAIHRGSNGGPAHREGKSGGFEGVALTVEEIPAHAHSPRASSSAADQSDPTNRLLAATTNSIYDAAKPPIPNTLKDGGVSSVGGGEAHENMQPSLTLSFCIAVQGVFPPRG